MTTATTVTDRKHAHAARVDGLRERMDEQRLDVVLAYSWGNHSYLDMNPVWYLSGFKQMGPHAAIVVPRDGRPTLLVTPAWDADRAGELTGLEVVAVAATDEDGFVAATLHAAAGCGDAVGLAVGSDPPLADRERWSRSAGRPIADASPLLFELAQTRDALQLELIDRGVAIAESAYDRALALARPGMAEYELMAELDAHMRELGADDAFLLMSSAQHNHCVHAATDRILEIGDIILAEISPSVEGEFIQICRTFVLGRPPSDLEREKFALLTECFHGGLRAARVGEPVAAVVDAVNQPLIDAGYERYVRPPYMRTRGHANGMGAPIPELRPGDQLRLLEGMSFELHPNQYLPETGYLMCGEPVIVERDGARPLTSRVGTLDWVA